MSALCKATAMRAGGALLTPEGSDALALQTADLAAANLPAEDQKPTEAPALAPAKTAARPKFLRQYELIDRVKSYDPTADEALLNRAYVYAMRMHGPVRRAPRATPISPTRSRWPAS